MRCDECWYWVEPDPVRAGYETKFGRCKQTPFGWDILHFVKDELGNMTWVVKPEYSDATAIVYDVYDGSGDIATLETKAEHFCAMFRPKATDKGADE